jgi:xanthine dehydrogenase small subunit
VRNSGTLCGNIANGSPIGDSMPVLIALGAEIELSRGSHTRRLPLDQFYLGYQRKDLASAEFITAVMVPAPQAGRRVASYKISKRFDQDISAVCAAFVVDREGDRISSVRIAFGGLAAIPARARATEASLTGRPWSLESIEIAVAALAEDFRPLTDLRASSAYRLQAAGNLLRRFYFETAGQTNALRTTEVVASAR